MRKATIALFLLLLCCPQLTFGQAGIALSVRNGTSDPDTCAPSGLNVFINRSANPSVMKVCSTSNTWAALATVASSVGGPASSTDLALTRWDGTTGLLLQNGVITSADWNGDLTGPSALTTTTAAGLAFTNQPANDGVEILSDDPLDITQSVTIIGTTTGTDTVVVETIALDAVDGTTPVASVKVDWGVILAVKLSASCAGTITVREASGDTTITTLATTVLSAGVETVLAANQSAWNRAVSLVSDGATTKQLGLKGTNSAGTTIYDSQALTGTTAVTSNSAFATVTEIYTGDIEGTRTATETATAGTKLDGSYISTGYVGSRVTTQFDKTDNTFVNVPGLSVPIDAGASYDIDATLYVTTAVVGGGKLTLSGTATATAIVWEPYEYDDSNGWSGGPGSRKAALDSAYVASVGKTLTVHIRGLITVDAGGTLVVQFAQSTTDAGASSVLVGSTLSVQKVP